MLGVFDVFVQIHFVPKIGIFGQIIIFLYTKKALPLRQDFLRYVVEMMGFEPMSKNVATYTSTSVVHEFDFACCFSSRTNMTAASLIVLFLFPQTEKSGVSC